MRTLLTLSLILITLPVQAQDNVKNFLTLTKIVKKPAFQWPVQCTLNEDCWVINYVDIDQNDDIGTDFKCLNRSYEGHNGTDIAVKSVIDITNGVPILSAANGVIKRMRNGEPDRLASAKDIAEIKKMRKECGNAIMIDHDNGIETVYCHLKNNSITVKQGQKVKAGERIALMGLSGMTQFPHLDFMILENKKAIDPFSSLTPTDKCGAAPKSKWHKDTNLTADTLNDITIMYAGFQTDIPTLKAIDQGDFTPLDTAPTSADKLIFWSTLYGLQKGDAINIEILDANLKTIDKKQIIQDKTRARQLYYIGKRLKDGLEPGVYTASITVTRKAPNKEAQKWQKDAALSVVK